MYYQNLIVNKVPFNISNTFIDISISNRVITRNKLIFAGCSLFDIQFLYPLFSDLTYSPVFKMDAFNSNYFTT